MKSTSSGPAPMNPEIDNQLGLFGAGRVKQVTLVNYRQVAVAVAVVVGLASVVPDECLFPPTQFDALARSSLIAVGSRANVGPGAN